MKSIRYLILLILSWLGLWKKPKITIVILTTILFFSVGFGEIPDTLKYIKVSWDQPNGILCDQWVLTFDDSVTYTITNPDLQTPKDTLVYLYNYLSDKFRQNREYLLTIYAENSASGSTIDSLYWMILKGDINGDSFVNGIDLLDMRREFGSSGVPYENTSDLNKDGYVNGLDLLDIRREFGNSY